MKIIQVCKEGCDNSPVEVKAGNIIHNFCCQKGFEESTRQFKEYMKNNYLKDVN